MNETSLRLLVHAGLAVLLFFCVNWLGKHSTAFGYKRLSLLFEPDEAPAFNLIFRILTPVVFLLLFSALFYLLKADFLNRRLFLVVVYYFGFRLGYNVLLGRSRLLNWPLQGVYVAATTGIAYLAQQYLIARKEYLFPNMATAGNELWFLIIGFLYLLLNSIRASPTKTRKRKDAYLCHRYSSYRGKFNRMIAAHLKPDSLEPLVYSIMIYEAFNRPKLYRLIENIGFFMGLSKTLGIMQVHTEKFITDGQSVRRACEKISSDALLAKKLVLEKDYSNYKGISEQALRDVRERDLLNEILRCYNGGTLYNTEVTQLLAQVKAKFYPKAVSLMDSV